MIKRHPRLVTLVGIVAMLSAFIVPAALAAPPSGSPACEPGRNPHCEQTTTSTTTRTTTRTSTHTGTETEPPTGTETLTDTVTETSTSTAAGAPHGCEKKGIAEPPCGGKAGTETSSSTGIPIGIVFLVLGLAVMSYLWIHRRRTLKLDN